MPTAAPGAPAPTVTTPVIETPVEEVPLQPIIEDENDTPSPTEQVEGRQEFTEAVDDEVPLDNMNLAQNVKHCILHFVELLLAAAVGGTYIASTRKQKREIAKLKDGDEER